MSDTISEFEEILRACIPGGDRLDIDLGDDNDPYRRFYFDHLSEEGVKAAFSLFPNSSILYSRYLSILDGLGGDAIGSNDLCSVVDDYLQSAAMLMDTGSDELGFIRNCPGVFPAQEEGNFGTERINQLHRQAYGTFASFVVDNLPDEDALWLLYDWSIEKTRWSTVSAYFLETEFNDSRIAGTDFFKAGFDLWRTRNSDRYWAENNALTPGGRVYCKPNASHSG